jgi:hypothetical protein
MRRTAENDIDPVQASPASSESSGEPPSRSAADLRHALVALGTQFARAVDMLDDAPATAEIETLVQAGAADAALLASAFACLARTQNWGPALALGPWSGSLLLSLCGGGLDRFADLDDQTHGSRFDDLLRRQEIFLSLLARGDAGPPCFLVCLAPPDQVAQDLTTLLPGCPITIAPGGDAVLRIQFLQDPPPALHIASGSAPLAEPAATLHSAVSMSWRVLCLATSDVEQRTGQRIGWLADQVEDEVPGSPHPALRWLSDVPPQLWPALLNVEMHPSSSEARLAVGQTQDHGGDHPPFASLSALDAAPPAVAGVLQTRLALIRQIARLAEVYPDSVWGATLASAPAGARAAIMAAAHAAGVETLPPSEVAPALSRPLDEVAADAQPLGAGDSRAGLDASPSPAGTPPDPFRRTVCLGDEPLELSLDGGTKDAPVRVFRGRQAPDRPAAGAEAGPYTPVEVEGALLWIARDLAREDEPGMVRVRLPLSGSEEADLALIDAVRQVLLRFPGPHHATIELHYAARSRLLPSENSVAWSPDLEAALGALAGEHAVTFGRAEEA